MYIDYEKKYVYVREIEYIENYNSWDRNFKESVLVIDGNTGELITRLELLEDEVGVENERIVIAY